MPANRTTMNTTTILSAFVGFLLGAIFAFWLDMYLLARKQSRLLAQAKQEQDEIDRAEIDRLRRYAK